jgi:hypothetical protein
MNCQNFEIIVNELARRQMMQADVREQALMHTSECAACALRLADERALTQQLCAVTIEMNELEAPARIETEILAAFREHRSTPQFTKWGPSAIYNWRYWVTAAAAVLLIVIGIAATRSRPAPVATENPYVPTIGPKVADNKNAIPPDIVDEPKPESSPEQGTTLAGHNPKRHANTLTTQPNSADGRSESEASVVDRDSIVAANYGGNEIATDFLPVGYASPMSLQDG